MKAVIRRCGVWTATVLVLYGIAASLANAEASGKKKAPADYGVRNPEALAALRGYERAERKARDAYVREVDASREKLITGLNTVKAKLTKAGDLEGAVAVRDAIEQVKATTASPAVAADPKAENNKRGTAAALTAAMRGTKWKKVLNGTFTMTFNPDMTLTSTHHPHQGTWVALSGDSVRYSISMNSCQSLVYKVTSDGKMLWEDGQVDAVLETK